MAMKLTTAGESHGPGLTCVLEGVPAGLVLDREAIDADLARRQQGYGRSPRQQIERDRVEVLAGLGAGLFLFLFAVIFRGALGMGDVKLGGVLGLYLSGSVVVAIVAGILAGGVAAVIVLARTGIRAGAKTKIAYGPYLAIGGIVGLLAGPHILHWYSHSLH